MTAAAAAAQVAGRAKPSRRRRACAAAASLAAAAPGAAAAFQSPAPRSRWPGRRWRLSTASRESAEAIGEEGPFAQDDGDAPGGAAALRRVTFLGLCAPASAEDDDDAGDAPETNALDARNLSEFLLEVGACSVSITDADADTDLEAPLFDEPSSDGDAVGTWAMVLPDLAAGRNLWKRCDVSAHVPSSIDVSSLVASVRSAFDCPSGPRFAVDDVPDLDWMTHVQESWTPIVTPGSKFALRFPWHDDADVLAACQGAERGEMERAMQKQFDSGVKREGAVVHFEDDESDDDDASEGATNRRQRRDYVQLRLEGGIAFGTGEHPTTRLCLDWVRDEVERLLDDDDSDDDEPVRFLDYGAGSGILGLAAASIARDRAVRSKRSPRPSRAVVAVGVEIDGDAVRIANANAAENGVSMETYLPDLGSLDAEALSVAMLAWHRGDSDALRPLPEELNGPIYDLCAANILAGPLVGLAPVVAGMVKSGGRVGLSGVLAGQAGEVAEAYAEFFDDVTVAAEEGGWVLLTGERR